MSAVLALVLAAAAADGRATEPYVVALVVGLNASRDPDVPSLKYADDDAARFAELFTPIADKVVLLTVLDADSQERHPQAAATSRPPSRVELDSAVAALGEAVRAASKAGRRTEFFFFYAGHGSVTPQGEGSVNLVDGVLLRRDLFRAVLDPVPADFKHVIIDACDAYFMVAKRGAAASAEVAAMKTFLDGESLAGHPEVGVLISGSREIETHEWAALESGVFSHEIRSALLGGADADGDGVLRYSEVAAFVAAANEGLSDPRARVDIFARPPQLDLSHPVVDLRRGPRRFVELSPSLKGRVRVEDARGVRYADLNVSGEVAVYVRLIGADEYFFFRGDREARVAAGAAGILALGDAAFGARRRFSRGAIDEDLKRGLFSTPYGLGFLRGFVSRDPSGWSMPDPAAAFPDVTYLRSEVSTAPPGSRLRKAGWVALGGAVALGAGSAISAALTRDSFDGFVRRIATEGSFDQRQIQQVENYRLSTNLLLAGAVITAAAGVLLLWLSDSSSSSQVALGLRGDLGLAVRF